jgi:hypothetical protein
MIFEELPTLASCPDGVMETCSTSCLTARRESRNVATPPTPPRGVPWKLNENGDATRLAASQFVLLSSYAGWETTKPSRKISGL